MYKEAITNYLQEHSYDRLRLKAVLFDMDGVLFDSMPYHAECWHQVMKKRGLELSREEAYLYEGRTGASTINLVFKRQLGREATPEEINSIYDEKTAAFNLHPETEAMPSALALLNMIKEEGRTPMLVTGSGQISLLDKLEHCFPHIFQRKYMVTAFDVKHGKPSPEPYLMALSKGGLLANEAIVIENAPLGVESGVAAGIFTIAVNTGPLDDEVLLKAGANLLFSSIEELRCNWGSFLAAL